MKRALLAGLPLLLGLGLASLATAGILPNPTLTARAELGTVLLLVGLLFSCFGWLFVLTGFVKDRDRLAENAGILQQAATDRRRLLQRLDHELKNPLTAIRVGLANLAANNSGDENTLSTLEAQTLRLSRLTADLRKLSELETRPLELSDINLGDLLSEIHEIAEAQPGATERQLTLNIPQAPWPLPAIRGDHDLLFLALFNLVNNALKFTEPGDTIEIRASENENRVVIEVADTGPGIPLTEQPYVWEELYRGEGARGIAGSGLGLALVRAIVKRHEGNISLRSRPGQGTVVTVWLPI